ncbi:MAG: ABC transporter ATP-binding protein [Sulfurimonas sp.]|jgi:putative ABC transport system ATP-binding protein|nr:ABC transporter ATP-binding protein [Sulfurimonadaceae bacterium]
MIEVRGVSKSFIAQDGSNIYALDDINLHIKEGELVVLKGHSGSGKSTLLSLIASLNKPTSGEIIVDSSRVSKLLDNFASDFRLNTIGFVFQKYNLLPNLSVRDNVMLPLAPLNLPLKEVEQKVDRALAMFKIEFKKNQLVKNLSGGEQQRVAIARANVNNPKIIVADEPTANLDHALSLHFIDILKDLKNEGKTIVVATHDSLFFELDIVDRVIEIQKGKLCS